MLTMEPSLMTQAMPHSPNSLQPSATLKSDLLLVAFLIGLGIAARLLPHAPNFTPLMASTLFAAAMLRHRGLAVLVPFVAMPISDLVIGPDDWRIKAVIYATMLLPVFAGVLARRHRLIFSVAPAMLSCSLIFFVTTNFAVWAFSGMYSLDWAGLITCYIAALPYLKQTVASDLLWTGALFGSAYLVQRSARARRANAATAS
jgi:hypothetical protein